MSVKTEMVNMPEKTCDSKMGVPQMAPMPMANSNVNASSNVNANASTCLWPYALLKAAVK